jgi:FkbM family methyltransferase
VAERADICLHLAAPLREGATLSASVMPFLTPQHPQLTVRIHYREIPIGEWSFDCTGATAVTMDIESSLIAGDCSPSFSVHILTPRRPSETGQSSDSRLLGLGFQFLRLERNVGTAGVPDPTAEAPRVAWAPDQPPARQADFTQAFIEKATAIGRRVLPGTDIGVFWQGMWIYRLGPHYFPMPEVREPEEWIWHDLSNAAARYLHEAESYWYHLYRPKAGDVVVDIGAGRGEDAYAFSRAVGDAGRIYACEAHPTSFAALEKFCALNRVANVTALNVACLDQSRRVQIETLASWKQNYIRQDGASATSLAVEGVPFDRIWEEHGIGCINLLKMNIEGAERLALPGCRKALDHTQNVSVATHDYRAERGEGEWFRTGGFVRAFLQECGFHVTVREDCRDWARGHIHATRRH